MRSLKKKLQEKSQGESAARDLVFRAVEDWTGHAVDEFGALPIVRNGIFQGYTSSLADMMLGGAVNAVGRSVWADDTKALKDRKETFERLIKAISQVQEHLNELKLDEAWRLNIAAPSNSRKLMAEPHLPHEWSLEEKVIFSVGYLESAKISLDALTASARQTVGETEKQVSQRPKLRGRPRSEAKYATALEFARLYYRLTGEVPTYSEGTDGLSGKFTPWLRGLFNAIGWNGASLEEPAKAAIAAVEAEMDEPPESPDIAGLLGWADH